MNAATTTKCLRDWLKLDLEVTSALRVRAWETNEQRHVSGPAVYHSAVELTWIESGAARYRIGSREITAFAGHVVVVPREIAHVTTFLTPMRGVALWLGADLIAEVAEAMGPSPGAGSLLEPVILEAKGDRIGALFGVLAGEARERARGHTLASEAIAEAIVVEMLRAVPREAGRAAIPGARDPRVLSALTHIHACYAEPLTIDAIAKAARVSRFHLSRLFRDEVGEAPYQYLVRLRVSRAAELLRGGHHSVTEAAFATGFQDLSRFSRMFRAHTGKRPGDLRREHGSRSVRHDAHRPESARGACSGL